MGKSLADQISDIAIKPVIKDYDIEDEENTSVFQHDENGAESDLSDNEDINREQAKKSHYLEVEKSALRAEKGLELNDPKYTGVKGSRQALYDDSSNSEDMEDDEMRAAKMNKKTTAKTTTPFHSEQIQRTNKQRMKQKSRMWTTMRWKKPRKKGVHYPNLFSKKPNRLSINYPSPFRGMQPRVIRFYNKQNYLTISLT